MENVAYPKKPNRCDRKVALWKSGDFTVGVSQPPKKNRDYKPLEGISSYQDFCGAKIKQQDIENPNYYFTEAGLRVKPITRISIPDRQPVGETDPATLESLSIAYDKAGNRDMAEYFANAYAMKLSSGQYIANVSPELSRDDDDWGDLSDSSMGLSDAINSHKSISSKEKYIKISDLDSKSSRRKRGSGGITPHAKKSTKSAVQIMQEKYSIYCLAFGTVTTPALSPSENALLNANYSEFSRQLFQELGRLAARRGLSSDYVFVVEIQEKRYRQWGQFCPHIHFVMQSRKDRFSAPAIHYSELRKIVERLYSNLLGRKVDCAAATQWEKMKRRKVGEMGKYMTKGSQIAKEAIANGDGDMLPSAWSGMSSNLRKEVKASIKILTGQDAEDFIESLDVLKSAGLLSYVPIMWSPPDSDRQITIGFCGWVKNWNKVCQFLSGCYENFAVA